MEYSHSEIPPTPYQKIIIDASKAVEDVKSADKQTADAIVEQLNIDAMGGGLFNEKVLAQSEFTILSTHTCDVKTGKFSVSFLPDDEINPTTEGTFLGFKHLPYAEGQVLMYQLQTGYDPDHQTFYMADIPVEGTSLSLVVTHETPPEDREAAVTEQTVSSLNVLGDIEDDDFVNDLNTLLSTIEKAKNTNAEYYTTLGHITTHMLAHEKVKDNFDYQSAILGLLSVSIVPGAGYVMRGHSFPIEHTKEVMYGIMRSEYKTEIVGLDLVDDYRVDADQGLIATDNLQPAFIVLGENDKEYCMPLSQLEEMRMYRGPEELSCSEVIDRNRAA